MQILHFIKNIHIYDKVFIVLCSIIGIHRRTVIHLSKLYLCPLIQMTTHIIQLSFFYFFILILVKNSRLLGTFEDQRNQLSVRKQVIVSDSPIHWLLCLGYGTFFGEKELDGVVGLQVDDLKLVCFCMKQDNFVRIHHF